MKPSPHLTRKIRARAPKHHQAREALRKMIDSGRFPPGSRLPPETDLPQQLKVSRQTVRRALNDLVREGLIVRIQGSGSYVADRSCPPLLPGRNLCLGLLLRDEMAPSILGGRYGGGMIRGALAGWGLDGVEPVFPEVDPREATRAEWSRPEGGVKVIALGEPASKATRCPTLRSVKDARFDGVVALGITEEPFIERLTELNLPVVLADYVEAGFAEHFDQVFVDPLSGYGAAVKHFLNQGLRRVHYIGNAVWPAAPDEEMSVEEWQTYRRTRAKIDPDSLLRLTACRNALGEAGLELPEAFVHFTHTKDPALEELAGRLFSLPEEQRPEVVLGHGIHQAEIMIRHFEERGVRLVGAGAVDEGWSGRAMPIRSDMAEVGATAAALLVSRLERASRPTFSVGVRIHFDGTYDSAVAAAAREAASAPVHAD